MILSPPVLIQYLSAFPVLLYIRMLHGLYTSVSPNTYPSYHSLATLILPSSVMPSLSTRMPATSSSVNPNHSSRSVESTLFTYRLSRSENMLSFATWDTPVITHLVRCSLSLSAAFRNLPTSLRMVS